MRRKQQRKQQVGIAGLLFNPSQNILQDDFDWKNPDPEQLKKMVGEIKAQNSNGFQSFGSMDAKSKGGGGGDTGLQVQCVIVCLCIKYVSSSDGLYHTGEN